MLKVEERKKLRALADQVVHYIESIGSDVRRSTIENHFFSIGKDVTFQAIKLACTGRMIHRVGDGVYRIGKQSFQMNPTVIVDTSKFVSRSLKNLRPIEAAWFLVVRGDDSFAQPAKNWNSTFLPNNIRINSSEVSKFKFGLSAMDAGVNAREGLKFETHCSQ
jgi:hypothetical protein